VWRWVAGDSVCAAEDVREEARRLRRGEPQGGDA